MNINLKNKGILVTGGSRGIGKNIALDCAKSGAHVFVLARSQPELTKTVEEIKSQDGVATPIQGDVSNSSDLKKAFEICQSHPGGIYGVVAAAGVYGPIGPFWELEFKEWKKGVEVNLFGTTELIHLFAPQMIKNGEGRFVLFSGGGQASLPNFSCYVGSKGALWRLTETLGEELAPHGVFLNALAPGAVNTQFLDDLIKAGPEKVGRTFFDKALKQKASGGDSSQLGADLTLFLLNPTFKGLFGKTLSAKWDAYKEFNQSEIEKMNRSDIFTFKRVVDFEGKTR